MDLAAALVDVDHVVQLERHVEQLDVDARRVDVCRSVAALSSVVVVLCGVEHSQNSAPLEKKLRGRAKRAVVL